MLVHQEWLTAIYTVCDTSKTTVLEFCIILYIYGTSLDLNLLISIFNFWNTLIQCGGTKDYYYSFLQKELSLNKLYLLYRARSNFAFRCVFANIGQKYADKPANRRGLVITRKMTFTDSLILSRTLGLGTKRQIRQPKGKNIRTCSLYQLHTDDRYLAKTENENTSRCQVRF